MGRRPLHKVLALVFGVLLLALGVGCGASVSVTTQTAAGAPTATGSPSAGIASDVRTGFEAQFGAGPFKVARVEMTVDSAGAQVLAVDLTVPSVQQADPTIADAMFWLEKTIHSLNSDKRAGLDVLHVVVTAPMGETVVDWTEDAATGNGTGHWAGGITNYWFPHPDTTNSTSTTLAVSIPPELSVFAGLVEGLQAQGVQVAGVRPLPSSAGYGSGIEVVLRATSTGQKTNPEDVMAYALVFRAAVLARAAGIRIDGVGIAYQDPSGEIVSSNSGPVNKSIDPAWQSAAGLTANQVTERVMADVSAKLASRPFRIADIHTTVDPDGTTVLWGTFTVSGTALDASAEEPGNAMADAALALNSGHQAKIGVIRTEVDTEADEPLYWVFSDQELEMGTSWQSDALGTYFRVPPTWSSPATTAPPVAH
jgi:hypothetical protein